MVAIDKKKNVIFEEVAMNLQKVYLSTILKSKNQNDLHASCWDYLEKSKDRHDLWPKTSLKRNSQRNIKNSLLKQFSRSSETLLDKDLKVIVGNRIYDDIAHTGSWECLEKTQNLLQVLE